MDRRTFLATAGTATAGFAGCIGPQAESDQEAGSTPETVTNETNGYPDDSVVTATPEERDVDTASFETITTDGEEISLVPVDVAYHWYRAGEARFVDARGEGQYDRSRITGAVLSPANGDGNDATALWPESDRVVTYCGCPHHLSSMRAAAFVSNGHGEVYAIDEGFYEWRDQGYPVSGTQTPSSPDESASLGSGGPAQTYVVEGYAEGAEDGSYAWATHGPTDQQEATPIGEDGRYELRLHFGDLAPSAAIDLRTPTYELTAPLSDLTDSVVRGPDA